MSLKLNKITTAIDLDEARSPQGYLVYDEDLVSAANAAIALGKPLLLTGEPGIGKSEFASWLAEQPERCKLHRFIVKSTTEGNDLFYQFDTLGRFRDAQIEAQSATQNKPVTDANNEGQFSTQDKPVNYGGRSAQPLNYLTYDALGKAILMSLGKKTCIDRGLVLNEKKVDFIPPDAPTRSVVLIDEIDKAPRDVPNDILDEIDRQSFRIRELGNRRVDVNSKLRPIVVITSNSERDLPKPFLRRCIYYHMRFPQDTEVLRKIAERRVGKRYQGNDDLLSEALDMFHHLRKLSLNQQPGLAELLDWLNDLGKAGLGKNESLRQMQQAKASLKSALLKDKDDHLLADREWQSWLDAIRPQKA